MKELLNHKFDTFLQKHSTLPEDLLSELLSLQTTINELFDENEFCESSRHMQDIIEFLPDPTFVVDKDRKLISWNRAIENMTSVMAKDVLGKGNFEYSLPFYGERVPVLIDLVMDSDLKHLDKYDSVTRDGDTLISEIFAPSLNNGRGAYLWAISTPLYSQNGIKIGAIESVRDITKQKMNQRATLALYRISQATNTMSGLDDLFQSIHEILMDFIDVSNLFIATVDLENDRIRFPYFRDDVDEYLDIEHISQMSISSPTLEVIKTRTPLHYYRDNFEKLKSDGVMSILGSTPEDWIGVPLIVRGEILGALVVQDYNTRRFTEDDKHFLVTLSPQIALAIAHKSAEDELITSEEKYRSIFEKALVGVFQTAPEGTILSANPAFATTFGFESNDDLTTGSLNILDFYYNPDERSKLVNILQTNTQLHNYELKAKHVDGSAVWISLNVQNVYDDSGIILRYEGSFLNITQRKEAESALEKQKAYFTFLFENSPQAIAILDVSGKILNINEGFKELFKYDEVDSLTKLIPNELHDEHLAFKDALFAGKHIHEETVRLDSHGRRIPVSVLGFPFTHNNINIGAFVVYEDISARKTYENQLAHQAMHDSLTNLPNRILFMERLYRALDRSKRRNDYNYSVLMVDLDRFKRINDSYGHFAGDNLLIQVSNRLSKCIRSMDTVARLGGDEFAIILEEFRSSSEAIIITRRILDALQQPFEINENEVIISASIGIVLKTEIYDSAEDILRDADISMYRAKDLGKNRFKVFDKTLHQKIVHAVSIENEMRSAIANNEFLLVYQPIINMQDQLLTGFETLVRWDHPKRGLLLPSEFIPVAEESGLIKELGLWVLEKSCSTMANWLQSRPHMKTVLSVNLSGKQLSQYRLVQNITDILNATGLKPSHLTLEVTETAIMDDPETALHKLNRLKELGIKLSLDDFGTGYSSLSYLQKFPMDILKVDRTFVDRMTHDFESLEIVRTIIVLGRSLGMKIIAEGVENKQQLKMLSKLRCDKAQGYYFARPLLPDLAEALLDQQS